MWPSPVQPSPSYRKLWSGFQTLQELSWSAKSGLGQRYVLMDSYLLSFWSKKWARVYTYMSCYYEFFLSAFQEIAEAYCLNFYYRLACRKINTRSPFFWQVFFLLKNTRALSQVSIMVCEKPIARKLTVLCDLAQNLKAYKKGAYLYIFIFYFWSLAYIVIKWMKLNGTMWCFDPMSKHSFHVLWPKLVQCADQAWCGLDQQIFI